MKKPTEDEIREFIAFYGEENLPNPEQYPKAFTFKWNTWSFLKKTTKRSEKKNKKK